MRFIVRQISHTADGREIVRSTTLDKSELCVGRAAECDIQLADLAVALRHANITALSNTRLRVTALGAQEFVCDARPTQATEIDVKTGSELGFGMYRLMVSAEGEDVLIIVSRLDAKSETADGPDLQTAYTLKNKLPSRRLGAWALFLATIALFLAWPLYTFSTSHGLNSAHAPFSADQSWTAGPLSQAHKSLDKNCTACHVKKFEAVQDKACIACHTTVHDHADRHRLLLAKGTEPGLKDSFGKVAGRCVDCHNEHLGAGPMTPTAQQFCSDCHKDMKAHLPDTKLSDVRDFGTDHPNFKPMLLVNPETGQTEQRSMDGAISQFTGLKFTHAQHLSKTNGVARMSQTVNGKMLACKDCHTPTADGTAFNPVSMVKNCQSCHSLAFEKIGGINRTLRHGDPDQVVADIYAFYSSGGPQPAMPNTGIVRQQVGHYAAQANAVQRAWPGGAQAAVTRVFSKGGACYDCHIITPMAQGYHIMKVMQPSHYFTKGWFNHRAHATEDCASCHAADKSQSTHDVLIPDIKNCQHCHVGADGASRLPVQSPTPSSCGMCHDYHRVNEAPWRARGKSYTKN